MMKKKTSSQKKHSSRKSSSSKRSKRVSTRSGFDKNSVIAAISLFVILVSLVLMTFFVFNTPHDNEPFSRSVIGYDFAVSDKVGFVLDTDLLHFGGGPRGAKFERGLDINSSRDAKVVLSWQGHGNISVDRNNFTLGAGNSTSVTFSLEIPHNLTDGNYTGEIFVELYDLNR